MLLSEVMRLMPSIYLVPVQNEDVNRWYKRHGFHIESRFQKPSLYVKHPYLLRSYSREAAVTIQGGA